MPNQSILSSLKRFKSARRELKKDYQPDQNFKELEESCIPSYTHSNPILGWVAWQRLEAAIKVWRQSGSGNSVLDFGAGSGVLCSLLPNTAEYSFAELDDALAKKLLGRYPRAARFEPDKDSKRFDVIFALDSLEHNEDVAVLLEQIANWLKPDGIFILSGPSENVLYRFGRWLAGYKGHYHHQTIYDIEAVAERYLERQSEKAIPFGMPIFRVTSWLPK